MTDLEKEEKMRVYYADNAAKLHSIVDKQILRFGTQIWQKDRDDFYSVANDVFRHVLETWDGRQDFDKYLYFQLWGKICTYMTRLNRQKRWLDRNSISLDAPIEEGSPETYGEFVAGKTDIENDYVEQNDQNIQAFMLELTKRQKEILSLLVAGYRPGEVQGKLHISSAEYGKEMNDIKSYERIKHLIRKEDQKNEIVEEEPMQVMSAEKSKNTAYSTEAISRRLGNHQIRDNHILQRFSDQWSNLYKSEFVSDILQGRSMGPIFISEEIRDGVVMHWLIDGKQRCTVIDSFLHDGFAISKNVQKYMIPYQVLRKDAEGNDVCNEEGFPIMDTAKCDIRGKKFSKLPIELQDKFRDYQMPVMLNLNCTKEEIAYDIARYNRCRQMNKAQLGWTGMDENYAAFVDAILKMPFFKVDCPNSSYTNVGKKNGSMRRMVVESIMASDFPENFNKDFGKMCNYLSENANDSSFISFQLRAERIQKVADEDVAEMFSMKDSFIWFAMFSRFEKLGLDDKRFIDFMKAFKNDFHSTQVGNESYDEFVENLKGTKDKSVVLKKLNKLEEVMKWFLHMDKNDRDTEPSEFVNEFAETDLIKSMNVSKDQAHAIAEKSLELVKDGTESEEDAEETTLLLADSLNEWMLNIPEKDSRNILTPKNTPYLIGLAKYAYDKEYGDDECMGWLKKIAAQGKQNISDFSGMKHNLDLAMIA